VPPRSCEQQAPGADHRCGKNHDEDCCASPLVPGGTFNRLNDPRFPATISSFRMDKFEVTVGRLRRFVEGYPASWPDQGQGANPHIPGSGWRTQWFTPASRFGDFRQKEAILAQLRCDFELLVGPQEDPRGHQRFATWTDTPTAESETRPVNCVTWLTAFAFCAWDGGRLPTETEYLYVAAGGDEQREYPWGSAPWDDRTAQVSSYPGHPTPYSALRPLEPVGSRPLGASRWGQLDLLGGVNEYFFDARPAQDPPLPLDFVNPCNDCADTRTVEGEELDYRRSDIGNFASNPAYQYPTYLNRRGGVIAADSAWIGRGFRCVRDP